MEDMNITIEAQNNREREVLAETRAHIKTMTDQILNQQNQISQLEAQIKQLRGVLRAINRSAFDALEAPSETRRVGG
jgi:hypothetical protein